MMFTSSPNFTLEDQPYDDYEEEGERSQEYKSFEDYFFRRLGRSVPFGMNKEKDAYVLKSLDDTNDAVSMYSERNEARNYFSRDIRTFKNGTSVGKHCAPWGDNAVLCNDGFIIQKKFFSPDGLSHVLVKSESAPYNEYLLGRPYFLGWTDSDALKMYYDFST